MWGRWAVAIAITVIETTLGLWILSGRRTAAGALVSFFLNIGYFALMAITLLRGIRVPNCGCFGVFLARPLAPETYFDALRAPVKRLAWFEDSAHNVPFEEPDRFNAAVESMLRPRR